MIEFRVGEMKMYFKHSFNDNDFKCTDFIIKKYKAMVKEKTFMSSQTPKERPGPRKNNNFYFTQYIIKMSF